MIEDALEEMMSQPTREQVRQYKLSKQSQLFEIERTAEAVAWSVPKLQCIRIFAQEGDSGRELVLIGEMRHVAQVLRDAADLAYRLSLGEE